MKWIRWAWLLLAAALPAQTESVLDHSEWDTIVREYVNTESLVDYPRLKAGGLPLLDRYLAKHSNPWPANVAADERKAALINLYNALTVRWVAAHYPIESIWRTKKPFREARHQVDGTKISLDAIESELRNSGDLRIHAALVCAARGCPPLRREAYIGKTVNQQLDANSKAWLANKTLNEFNPETGRADISKIFDWYKDDFTKGGGLQPFLLRYGPAHRIDSISYKRYDWGLNDAAGAGTAYSDWKMRWDYLRNR